MICYYLYVMAKEKKATFTYTTLPSVKEKAKKKAEKEGYSISVKIDMMLREYIRPRPKHSILREGQGEC